MGSEENMAPGGDAVGRFIQSRPQGLQAQVVGQGGPDVIDPISIIDAQIRDLEGPQNTDLVENVEVPQELHDAAGRLFDDKMVDPQREQKMVDQLVEFAVGTQGVQGPTDLLNWFMKMDKLMVQEYPHYDMLSRAWFGMQKMKVQAAEKAMAHGP